MFYLGADQPPVSGPVARDGGAGGRSERAWKKRTVSSQSSVLARGVFCDGREEGEKEAPQSGTSKSSHSYGRHLINAERNTAL